LVISRHGSPEITPAVAKASAGAVEHLRVCQVAGIPQCLEQLKAAGFWTVGLAGEADTDYLEGDYRGTTALVVGGEGEGLHRLVRARCDQLVRLPMRGQVTSLNAAVAASIVLYEALRQRRGGSE
jgi:23S rRNA (guanosine2251-2'-O)-methyltransferase